MTKYEWRGSASPKREYRLDPDLNYVLLGSLFCRTQILAWHADLWEGIELSLYTLLQRWVPGPRGEGPVNAYSVNGSPDNDQQHMTQAEQDCKVQGTFGATLLPSQTTSSASQNSQCQKHTCILIADGMLFDNLGDSSHWLFAIYVFFSYSRYIYFKSA